MYIKATLIVLCLTALVAAQTSASASERDDGPDFGLTPSQSTAVIQAESSIFASLDANPTFASIQAALESAFPSTDPFSKLEEDFQGDGSHLPTGTSARAAIASDINALPTSGGVRSFFGALETAAYSQLDAILGIAQVTSAGTSGSAGAQSTTITTSDSVRAGSSSTSSASAAQVTKNSGPTVGVKGALGCVAVLGAVMIML